MGYKLIIKRKSLIPLWQSGDTLICQKSNSIIEMDLNTKSSNILFSLPGSLVVQIMRSINLLSRFFRKNVIWLVRLDSYGYIFSDRTGVYYSDIEGTIHKELDFKDNKYLFKPCLINGIKGFDDGIYAGEYYSNPNFLSTKIWFRKPDGEWLSIYKFPCGEINHIHGLYSDKEEECIWIMTGDFGEAPSLWRATNNFKHVEKATPSEQKYRACWMMKIQNIMYWASDTQLEQNSVYKAIIHEKNIEPVVVRNISGSSIYSTDLFDRLAFSTTLEPEKADRKNWWMWFDSKPAKVFDKDGANVYVLENTGEVICILKNEAHILPLRLFEYPTYLFPYNEVQTNYLTCYGRSVKKDDNTLLVFHLK